MSLSKAQLNKLSKEELVNFTFKIQEAHGKHIEDIVKKLDQALEVFKLLLIVSKLSNLRFPYLIMSTINFKPE